MAEKKPWEGWAEKEIKNVKANPNST